MTIMFIARTGAQPSSRGGRRSRAPGAHKASRSRSARCCLSNACSRRCLSNTTCLTHAFFKCGEDWSTLWCSLTLSTLKCIIYACILCVCVYIYIYIYICTCVYIYIYIYICAYIHIHIHPYVIARRAGAAARAAAGGPGKAEAAALPELLTAIMCRF